MINLKKCLMTLVFAVVCVSCYAQEAPIKVSIAMDEHMYAIRDDINVSVTIKNTTNEPVNTQVGPVFTLAKEDLQIWAPVRLDEKRVEVKRGETSLLTLEPFEEKTFEYNLAKEKWDSMDSPVWPTKPFRSIILLGNYILSFEVRKQNGSDTQIVSSNPLTVEITADHP